MKNRMIKAVIGVILLFASPLVFLTLIGIVYTIIRMLGGISFTAGINSYMDFIYSLAPYFPYLTTVPVIAVAIVLINKNKRKHSKVLQKH